MISPDHLARVAQGALLGEAELWPKPGLVDPLGHSTHPDMTLRTFLDSAVALGPWMAGFVRIGRDWAGPASDLLPPLRRLGVSAEEAMLAATGGVNTHRGAIFLFGLTLGALGWLSREGQPPTGPGLRAATRAIASGLVERDLRERGRGGATDTHGGAAWRIHGLDGVRGEAERGFPEVWTQAMPCLRAVRRAEAAPRAGRLDALLTLLSVTDDTTTVHRGGMFALRGVQQRAREALELGGAGSAPGRAALRRLCSWASARRLSSGGCADLLALALFLEQLEADGVLSVRMALPAPQHRYPLLTKCE